MFPSGCAGKIATLSTRLNFFPLPPIKFFTISNEKRLDRNSPLANAYRMSVCSSPSDTRTRLGASGAAATIGASKLISSTKAMDFFAAHPRI